MKKNLRIVSVAAAALLAVAPVAASAVSVASTVSAADMNNKPDATNKDVNTTFTVNASGVAATKYSKSVVTASVIAHFGGKDFPVNLSTVNGNSVVLTKGQNGWAGGDNINGAELKAGDVVSLKSVKPVGFNFGSENNGKTVTFVVPDNVSFMAPVGSKVAGKTITTPTPVNQGTEVEIQLDVNGTMKLDGFAITNVPVYSLTDTKAVAFYSLQSGTIVNSGDITVSAGQNYMVNVQQILEEFDKKYQAAQLNNTITGANKDLVTDQTGVKELTDQLTKMGYKVNDQGWFEAPKTFTVNFSAKSNLNGMTATLPVTVNVPNGKDTTVPNQSKTIMHNAYYYDKDAKRVGTDKLTRYNSVTVAMNTTTINGKAYYEVIENGKATGKYINADNIDGTKRTLKHNAYVYRSSKKRANKVVLKKGETVTTYGGSYTFKNGKKYYKIGNDTKKTYVKVANFD